MDLSIIIPCYNAEKTIQRCLESLLCDFTDETELIVVDDGSIDNTLQICDKMLSNNEHCHILSQENKGVSSARNYGLSLAKGEYIYFVDADDTVVPYAISTILKKIVKNKTKQDCIMFSHYVMKNNEKQLLDPGLNEGLNYVDEGFLLKYFKSRSYFLWDKIFRKEIITDNHILFNEYLKIHEDAEFCMEFMRCAQMVEVCNIAIYNYFIYSGSASKRHKIIYLDNYDHVYYYRKKYLDICNAANNDIEELNKDFQGKFWWTCCNLINQGTPKKVLQEHLKGNKAFNYIISHRFDKAKNNIINFLFQTQLYYFAAIARNLIKKM